MKAESKFPPNAITLDRHGETVDLVLAENIEIFDREGEGFYRYDEYRMTVRNRQNLQKNVESNFAEWIAKAKTESENQELLKTIPVIESATRTKLHSTLDVLLAEIGASDVVNSTTCNGIINTTNATINGSPATYIKALARMMKTNHRADIRDIKLILRELSTRDDLG